MSIPITGCRVHRAILNPAKQLAFRSVLLNNIECGGFTMLPCPHNPPCITSLAEPTEAQVMAFLKAVPEAMILLQGGKEIREEKR